MKTLYRYDDLCYAVGPLDLYSTNIKVILQEFPITKTTPKGVWINNLGIPRFVLLNAYKRFACPTKEEALESFMARKTRQIKILAEQSQIACEALSIAKNMQLDGLQKNRKKQNESSANLFQSHRKVLLRR